MSAPGLTPQQAVDFLRRLSGDDAYRRRFEQSPVEALQEVGVSAAVAQAIPPAAIDPSTLADAATLNSLADALSDESVRNLRCMCMVIPGPSLGFGK
ncbi:putative modified peptide [Tahibacter aquaticus]|uniref:Putative modified peptide n=1 Tax=Tahibacter aquaticus TaxID=520092 RepID=A0A4R6YSM7_9GAMM|nr:NHLP-related RiPP peptide [Tahibacter aquaticus]TDR41203.1 putative modified peptide [Tahibacter aquaticus]